VEHPPIVEQPKFIAEDPGLTLVKIAEGCKLEAYKDIVGIWTIGYGHTGPEVKEGLKWTQEQADKNVKDRYEVFRAQTLEACKLNGLEPFGNQTSALTSFAYNLGAGCVRTLTKGRTLEQVADAILLYHKAGGKPVLGLYIRRLVERDLFVTKGEFNPEKVFAQHRITVKAIPGKV
jgi:GH24 family phage-related lysozyme (muramidase)